MHFILLFLAIIIFIGYLLFGIIAFIMKALFRLADEKPTQKYTVEEELNSDNSTHDEKLNFFGIEDTVKLYEYTISKSILYTTALPKSHFPFAIPTSIPLGKPYDDNKIGYYPSLSYLNQNQKAKFLKWLSEGKNDPNIDIAYVYCYFYGLEYRALVEKKDLKKILFEIIKLLDTYPTLNYGYNFIIYLIFKIQTFTQEQQKQLLEILEKSEYQKFIASYKNSLLYTVLKDCYMHKQESFYLEKAQYYYKTATMTHDTYDSIVEYEKVVEYVQENEKLDIAEHNNIADNVNITIELHAQPELERTNIPWFMRMQNDLQNEHEDLIFNSTSKTLSIADYTITNSMLYTIDSSSSSYPFALSLKAAISNPLGAVAEDYYPSYSNFNSYQKAEYLKWLEEGKIRQNISRAYINIYFFGLEYRAIYEKKDLKETLFEVIKLVNTYKNFYDAYTFISFLIIKIRHFSEKEKEILLNFIYQSSKYTFSKEKITLIRIIEQDKFIYTTKHALLQLDQEYLETTKRKKEVLDFFISSFVENLEEHTYKLTSCKKLYSPALFTIYDIREEVTFEKITPSDVIIKAWKKGHRILNKEGQPPIKKLDNSSTDLSSIEKYTYLPTVLRKEIEKPKDINFFEVQYISIKDILVLFQLDSLLEKETLSARQSEFIPIALEALDYTITPDCREYNKKYKINDIVLVELKGKKNNTPIIIKTATVSKKGTLIPVENSKVKLDKEKVTTIMNETNQIQKKLQEIFTEETQTVVQETKENEVIKENNSLLLITRNIMAKPLWNHQELLQLSKEYNLMLNTMIEDVNNYTDDIYGDFLIDEDNGSYIINENIIHLIQREENDG